MRKLLAMVATMAMVLSMFAGIAFALDEVEYDGKVRLTSSSAYVTSKYGTAKVAGTIVDNTGRVIKNKTFEVTVEGYAPFEVTNGQFELLIETKVADGPVALKVSAVDQAEEDKLKIESADFILKYKVSTNTALDFAYTAKQIVLTGKVLDGNNVAVKDAEVELAWIDGAPVESGISDKDGDFGFIVPGFGGNVGKIGLYINGVLHVEGKVNALAMTLSASPNSGIVHSVGETEIKLSLSNAPKTTNIDWFLAYEDEDEVEIDIEEDTSRTNSYGRLEATYKADFSADKDGTYTIIARDEGGVYEGSTTIQVVNPTRFTLVDPAQQLVSIDVSEEKVEYLFDDEEAGGIYLSEFDSSDDSFETDFVYSVWVNGKQKLTKEEGSFEVDSNKLGSMSIRVAVYRDADATKAVFDKTYTVEISGWDVSIDVSKVIVDEEVTITVVVKDENGVPVNNALVSIGEEYYLGVLGTNVEDASRNITNGTYIFKNVVFEEVGKHDVYVGDLQLEVGEEVYAWVKDGVEVVGKSVYSVTSNVDTLLLGKEQTVTFTVKEDGEAFIPERVLINGEDAPSITAVDSNKDGIEDGFKVKITASDADLDPVVVRAQTADGKEMGEVELAVVAPELVVYGDANITEDLETTLKFSVVDPRTGDELLAEVHLEGSYVTISTLEDEEGRTINVDANAAKLGAADEHEVTILTAAAEYDDAEEDEEIVEVIISIELDLEAPVVVNGSFAVKTATLAADKDTIVIGVPNSLTLTYSDANGNAIVGKKVFVGDDVLISKTDENGQVFYAVAQAATNALVFNGETDTENLVELKVAAGYDTVAPVVSAPETTNQDTAVITITDNVRIIRVMINGVEDTSFFPGPTYTKTVNLVAGANTFTVQAMDNNYNTVSETVTITYTPPVSEKVVLQGETVVRQGEYLFVQLRQFEELGATFGWNDATKTATFVLDGKTVEVTVGSTTAVVDGVNATMPVAPFIVDGRTFVPTRFVAEALGMGVHWAAGDIVTITK